MYFIYKEDVDNYRFAVAKVCFLRCYSEYELFDNIPKTNCFLAKEKNTQRTMVISLFFRIKKKYEYEIRSFHYPMHYGKLKKSKKDSKAFVFSREFLKMYEDTLELAIKAPEIMKKSLEDFEFVFFEDLLFDHFDEKRKDRRLYKYYGTSISDKDPKGNFDKHGVFDGNISFVNPQKFNDPFDVNSFFLDGTDMSGLFRIFCSTQTPKDILMWSYYGSDHKGFCFEYRERDIINAMLNLSCDGICIVGKVKYSEKRPKQRSIKNKITITDIKFYVDAAFTKFKKWEHENEYRFALIIDDRKSKPKDYLSAAIPIREIYEGCNGTSPISRSNKGNPIITTKLRKSDNHYLLI